MKVFAAVAIVIVVLTARCTGQSYTSEETKRIQNNRDTCVKKTGVDPDLIDRADSGDFVEDEKLKCFTKCFYQKAGFVDDHGKLLMDVIKAKMPTNIDKEKALKVVEKCRQTGKNPCETVYLVHKCYFEHTHSQNIEKKVEEADEEESTKQDKTVPDDQESKL